MEASAVIIIDAEACDGFRAGSAGRAHYRFAAPAEGPGRDYGPRRFVGARASRDRVAARGCEPRLAACRSAGRLDPGRDRDRDPGTWSAAARGRRGPARAGAGGWRLPS